LALAGALAPRHLLIIGAGEVFESSLDVWALTKGKDLRLGPRVPKR
jgi:hypothetical protein